MNSVGSFENRSDSRGRAAVEIQDISIPDLHIDTLKVKSRNFH